MSSSGPCLSVMTPRGPLRPDDTVPYAALVRRGEADRLWQGQALQVQSQHAFAFVAACGYRVPVGTGVAVMGFRHPFEAALEARSLGVTMQAPVVAGFGPGAAILQTSLYGRPYASPLTACREYLTIVRTLLAGEVADHDGRYFSMHGGLPPLPGPPVEVGLGVLRPGMARLAGEVADVAITWLTPPAYLAEHIVPALREGAAAAGRPVPRLVTVVPVAVSGPERDPVDLVLAGNAPHLSMPHYRAALGLAGVPVDPGDLQAGARALVEAGGFVHGAPDVISSRLADYGAAGVDEVVLNTAGVLRRFGTRAALHDLATILGTRHRETVCPA